jgi:alpha-tubulin suppressor-like RCC1 family protein
VLGNGERVSIAMEPSPVSGGHRFVSIDAGWYHNCSLKSDGTVYCWGDNGGGKLGTTTVGTECEAAGYDCHEEPVAAAEGFVFISLSVGGNHACGVSADSVAYCWGSNSDAQLGIGSSGGFTAEPTPVAGGHRFSAVSAGYYQTCGITVQGDTYCWGATHEGERLEPTSVAGPLEFNALSAGAGFACATVLDGTGYCWGANHLGQLGDGSTDHALEPVPVSGGHLWTTIDAGSNHVCGITAEMAAYCWGAGRLGELGRGVRLGSSVPVPVVAP